MHSRILILDFGSQVTQLIARRVREAGVFRKSFLMMCLLILFVTMPETVP